MERKKDSIPKTTIQRLPLYYRALERMSRMEIEVISSRELGEKLDIPSTQVRKDLSYYGEFGRRGVGYEVSSLLQHLERILGLAEDWKMVLVGAGNLGRALVNYDGFRKLGFKIEAVFDKDPDKIGHPIHSLEVKHMESLSSIVTEKGITLGIIAVPFRHAQEVADSLVDCGIKGIWNFAPGRIKVPDSILIHNEDLSVGLIGLVYHLLRVQ